MQLDRYVTGLRTQLAATAAAGGEDARELAEQLATSLDAAMRMALLESLSDAAGEITRDLSGGSVDVRLRGRDPEFVVTLPAAPDASEEAVPETAAGDGGATTRTTVRLPEPLKARLDAAAASEGLSVNAWMVRALAAALEPQGRRAAARKPRKGDSFTGWVS